MLNHEDNSFTEEFAETPIGVTVDSNSPGAIGQAPHVKYQRLTRIDRAHAESLSHTVLLSSDAKRASRVLANRSLRQSILTSLPLIATDFFILWGLLFAATNFVEWWCGLTPNLVTRNTSFVASLLLVPIAHLAGLYPALGMSAPLEFRQLVKSAGISLCIFTGIGVVANAVNWEYFVTSSFLTLLLAIPTLPAARFTARYIASRYSWWGAPVLIYARIGIAKELFQKLQRMEDRGLRPAAVLLSAEDYWSDGKRLQQQGIPTFHVQSTLECAQKFMATWILIDRGDSQSAEPFNDVSETETEFNAIPNRVLISRKGFDCGLWDQAHTIGSIGGMRMSNDRHCGYRAFLKRMLDIMVSLAVIVLGSPFLLGIAIATRFGPPGPLFYSQRRIGRGGRSFSAWKFRTMLPDADLILQNYLDKDPELSREWEETHKLKSDPRVTSVGRFLRKFSLDELPQLWNILRGDMSLVGPRPIVNSPNYDAKYINSYPNEFAAYVSMRPGLTGLWQVNCRNSGVYEMRIYWDMYYIRNWSLWLDLYIVLRTFKTVLLREGAY